MAREAPHPVKSDGLDGLAVRIVAGSAPHPPFTLASAQAAGQLLGMTDYLEGFAADHVGCEDLFQKLARVESG